MISKQVISEIDKTIKQIWTNNIFKDYFSDYMLKEDSLKCCFYYHLRRKLAALLKENNLRIYPEYYFSDLHYRADIAIVQIDPERDASHLKDMVSDTAAVIELKYVSSQSERTAAWVRQDIAKIKDYVQSGGLSCQFYFAVISESECTDLNWVTKRSANHWASGCVTELSAGYLGGEMYFKVNSYNGLNESL